MVDDVAAQFHHTTRRPEWHRFALPDEFSTSLATRLTAVIQLKRVAKAMMGTKVITRLRFAIFVLFF